MYPRTLVNFNLAKTQEYLISSFLLLLPFNDNLFTLIIQIILLCSVCLEGLYIRPVDDCERRYRGAIIT